MQYDSAAEAGVPKNSGERVTAKGGRSYDTPVSMAQKR